MAAPATTWTPPVYSVDTDFTCGAAQNFCVTQAGTAWELAVQQFQTNMNDFAAVLGIPSTVLVTGAIGPDSLTLAQTLGRVITGDWKLPTTPALTALAAATTPQDIAPYPTHLSIDFSQAIIAAKALGRVSDKRAKAQASWSTAHTLIAGGSTLAVIGATIAIVSARSKKKRRS